MDTRQLITGLLLALAAFFAYQWILNKFYPPPPPATQPAVTETAPAPTPTTRTAAETQPPAPRTTAPAPRRDLVLSTGESREPVTIGGKPDDALELTLTPRGAGVDSIRLTQRRNGQYVHRAEAKDDKPYEILDQMQGGAGPLVSFATHRIRIKEYDDRSWRLDDLVWRTEATDERVVFTTALQAAGSDDVLLRLTNTYELPPDKPLINLGLTIENTSSRPLTVTIEQDAAASIRRESPMYEMRRLLAARHTGETVESSKTVQRGDLTKGESVELFKPGQGRFAWTVLANRFYGVFTRPLPIDETGTNYVQHVGGTLALPESDAKLGDLVARMTSQPPTLSPGEQVRQLYEIYVGPKEPELLETVDPDFVDSTKIYYNLAQAADRRCCTFEPLPQIMIWLLHSIQYFVRNYGIAIMILVIIVRTLLHPLTVYQQKQMFRMQDSMARLQPKMQAIKERCANDKVKQNQETMKLYADEGVNPMGSLVGMLPLFIQMPILVALWTGLNTDIALRHAPFDGWWITDLAAPDALIAFSSPISIPLLAELPFLGTMFSGIPSFNLLPILMGVSMWFQQKYMPKPGMKTKLEASKKDPPQPRKAGQTTPQDQLRQQQMIGYMMTIMFPLMFYYMPAGLNLYWMSTNVFGIGESLIIRKQIREEKERREREGPQPRKKKKTGVVGRILKRLAQQAEEIQRKADTLADQDTSKKSGKGKDQKKR